MKGLKTDYNTTAAVTIQRNTDGTVEILLPKKIWSDEIDAYGRDVTNWINVNGKTRPHP